MPTLFPDKRAGKALLRMVYVIAVTEEAFGLCGEGRGRMATKTYLSIEHAGFGAMHAALPGCAGGKIVNVQPEDPLRGSPSMQKGVKTYESGS